jgi:hypothetical protein
VIGQLTLKNNIKMSSELTKLGVKYDTDKSTFHNFTDFYDLHLHKFKNEFKNILEIGVFYGASLKMWKDYFPDCNIFGIDTEDKREYNDERTIINICEQTDFNKINELFEDEFFDLIIDDGCHLMREQQLAFLYFSKKVKKGGIYIIEDLHTSIVDGKKISNQTTLDMVESLRDGYNFTSDYIKENDFNYLKGSFNSVEIFEVSQNNVHKKSITSIMYKK